MKNRFLKNIVIASVAGAGFAGCLKDKDYDNLANQGVRPDETGTFIEIAGSALADANRPDMYYLHNLSYSTADTTFDIVTVRLAANKPAQEDIKVTLVQVDTLVSRYCINNGLTAAAGDSLLIPAAAMYTIPSYEVLIPKGSYTGTLKAKVNPVAFATGGPWAFGFAVKAVNKNSYVVSGNYASIITPVGVKNRFDAFYQLRIKTTGWAAYGISDNLPGTWPSNADRTSIAMITSGANSVKMFDAFANHTYIQPAFTTGNAGATGFGATEPKFIFNMASNQLVNVVNDATPDPRNRQFRLNPAITNNRFDPATRSIYAAYILSQNGRPDQYIYDTLTFVKER